jgi:hypothetical protein
VAPTEPMTAATTRIIKKRIIRIISRSERARQNDCPISD